MSKKILTFCILISTIFTLSCYADSPDKNTRQTMKENTLEIVIHKPIKEVFNFTTDPRNTPEWIDSIKEENTNEWPPKIGTFYKNRNSTGPWATYKITKYKEGKEFELVKEDGSTYHVNYTYFTLPKGNTKLVYHEWVTQGTIDGPFTQDVLQKLKLIMEKN